MAKELLNLRADCIATSSYFIVETMGRKAGWLSYGVAIAGEANMVLSTEDVRTETSPSKRPCIPTRTRGERGVRATSVDHRVLVDRVSSI